MAQTLREASPSGVANGAKILAVDVLIVGAGFSALAMLNRIRLRKQGLQCKVYEKGASSGGIWYWNCYPGARVDSESPIYQFFDKDIWESFTFTERYPSWKELRQYFEFVEKKWDVAKHIVYNKNVDNAEYDETRKQWLIGCSDGSLLYARWLIPCVGFAARTYTPSIRGLGSFSGDVYHTANWPQFGVKLENKRVAVIGTGASGVQVIQQIGPDVSHLTIFQRTPNYALPMIQRALDPEEERRKKLSGEYEKSFAKTCTTFAGFEFDFSERKAFDDSPETREAFFDELFTKHGGFRFWLNTYPDVFRDEKANCEAYRYWRKKVLERVPDPKKQALLAPEHGPHPWGTKRPALERNYYEVVSLPHVDLIDSNARPIEEIISNGIRTRDGIIELDSIIFATGFYAMTGGLAQMGIRGKHGKTVAEHWGNGTRTSIGIAMANFPNLFFLYGPQAPTAFCNGPSCVQVQADWVASIIEDLTARGIREVVATVAAEEEWSNRIQEEWNQTLFPLAKSWYQGANIPGGKVEALNWCGGLPRYKAALEKSVLNNYQDWIIS